MGKNIIRINKVCSRTSLSKSTIWRMEQKGKFPRRIKLGENSVGWNEQDVDDWIDDRCVVDCSSGEVRDAPFNDAGDTDDPCP